MRAWQERRSRLNHDGLKNGLALELARYRKVLEGKVKAEGDAAPPSDGRWRSLLDEVAELVGAFPEEMSPRVLFSEPPLSGCDPATKAWLPAAVHAAWLERFRVEALVSEAKGLVAAAVESHDALCAAMQAGRAQAELLPLLRRLQDRVEALSKAVSRFPDRILPP